LRPVGDRVLGYQHRMEMATMEQTTIAIEGMSCGHCVAAVKGALGRLDGVQVQEVKVGSATVKYDPRTVTAERIAQAVEDEGYAAQVAGS
jgi:copper chaperone